MILENLFNSFKKILLLIYEEIAISIIVIISLLIIAGIFRLVL